MKFILLVIALNLPLQVQAYYQGAVTRGTGGAGLAAIEASETPFANPAGMAYLEGAYFTGAFGAGTVGEQEIAVALTENMRDTLIPTAFSYVQSHEDLESGKALSRQFRLAIGKPLVNRLAWGVALHHDENLLNEDRRNDTNISLGLLYAATGSLGFAILAEDLFSGAEAQQTLSLGASYSFRSFVRFKFDVTGHLEDSMARPDVAVGVENYLNKWVILRLGAGRLGAQDAYKYSAGVGFVLPRFGVHYAYQMAPDRKDLSSHSVDMAFPIW